MWAPHRTLQPMRKQSETHRQQPMPRRLKVFLVTFSYRLESLMNYFFSPLELFIGLNVNNEGWRALWRHFTGKWGTLGAQWDPKEWVSRQEKCGHFFKVKRCQLCLPHIRKVSVYERWWAGDNPSCSHLSLALTGGHLLYSLGSITVATAFIVSDMPPSGLCRQVISA